MLRTPSLESATERAIGERARLHLRGVRRPIVTTVARRRTDALVVVQDLPFLKLHSEVLDDQHRRARIARVAVDVQRDVPRLVLELTYDAADGDASADELPASEASELLARAAEAALAEAARMPMEGADATLAEGSEALERRVASSSSATVRTREPTVGYETPRERVTRASSAPKVASVAFDDTPAARAASVEVSASEPPMRRTPLSTPTDGTLVFAVERDAARDERPSTPPHLAQRGSELTLSLRAMRARLVAARDALANGVTEALAALREDP